MKRYVVMPLVVALLSLGPLPASTAAEPPTPATCDAPLILKLLPIKYAGSSVPTDLPPYPVYVALPLYPDARPLSPAPSPAAPPGSMSPYEKAASAEYTLPVDAGAGSAWYAAAMKGCGYLRSALATTIGATGVKSYESDYAATAIPSLRIQLSFEPQSGGEALFTAWAEVDALPPRPSASYIPSKVNAVEITYRTDGINPPYKHVYKHTVVSSPLLVGQLIAAVNGPSTLEYGPHSCGGRDYHVNLTFRTPKGRAQRVLLECNEVTVGTFTPLWDEGGEALLAVQYVLARVCHGGRCKR